MKKVHFLICYLIYKLKAINEHGVHSPFVFELYNKVLKNKTLYYSYETIEKLRSSLLIDRRKINVTDFGAGSNSGLKKVREVSQIIKVSAKRPKYGQLLFDLVNYFQPKTIIELGTSLGISTSYLAMASTKSKVYTFEGCPETFKIANENFKKLNITNVVSINGNFDTELPQKLIELDTVDFVFFDGNHRKEATLNYFNLCLAKINNDSVFVFDDIYWSAEMTEAWDEIKNNSHVTVSLDLFQLGIVFFRKEQVKQHFILRY